MDGTAIISGGRGPWRAGVRGGITATGRGLALAGLALTSLALLLVPLVSLLLIGLGVMSLFMDRPMSGLQRAALSLTLLAAGLVLGRLFGVRALLALRALTQLTRRLAGRWSGLPIAEPYRPRPGWTGRRLPYRQQLRWLAFDPATWRDLAWTLVGAVVGVVIAALPFVMMAMGLLAIRAGLRRQLGFGPATLVRLDGTRSVTVWGFGHAAGQPLEVFGGLALVGLGLAAAPLLLCGYAGLANALLAPAGPAELAQRVDHLTQTRTETIDSGAAEIRRIERDLHDGAQARLVAVGMTLGAAEDLIGSSPDAARALLVEARAASAQALAELRALVRGIHPPVLADRGLADAIRALALDSGLKVDVTAALPGRPQPPVESAAYFAVCELLANVSKHAGTRQAWIDLHYERGLLRVDVTDNGTGGADPAGGTGLRGIERRVAAFDGILALNSPVGGPTVATMEIPCALSSLKTFSC